MTNRELGKQLKAMRERAGLSQDALALRLGCKQGYVSKKERAETTCDAEQLAAWADACGAYAGYRFEPPAIFAEGVETAVGALSPAHQALLGRIARAHGRGEAGRGLLVAQLSLLAESSEREAATEIIGDVLTQARDQRQRGANDKS